MLSTARFCYTVSGLHNITRLYQAVTSNYDHAQNVANNPLRKHANEVWAHFWRRASSVLENKERFCLHLTYGTIDRDTYIFSQTV